MTDPERIVRDLQKGVAVEENMEALFGRFYGPVRQFFMRRGLSAEESADLVQETFIQVYRGIPSFRGDARFETWLFRVMSNVYRKAIRTRYTLKRGGVAESLETTSQPPGMALLDTADDAEQEVLLRERVRRVEEAVEQLPTQMRRVMILRLYHDLGYREIASLLALSESTVRTQVHQARQRLQQALATDR